MSAELGDARRKVERANKHITDLDERIRLLGESHTATIEVNAGSGKAFIKHDLSDRKARVDIAVIAGDAIHNLNCALDYAWWKIRERLPSESLEDDLRDKFPVRGKPDELKGFLRKRKIDVNWVDLYTMIVDDIKPYKGGDIAVWRVHKADNFDKHRLLLPFVYFASIEGVEFEDEMGRTERQGYWPITQEPPHYVDIPNGFQVKNYGSISLSILFHEEVFDEEFRAVDSLKVFSQAILNVVELLESL